MKIDISLEREKGKNLYIQLYQLLKEKIINNQLKTHSRLPAIRKLAKRVGVNPATVVKAYDLLEREELIYKKVGSGSYVAPLPDKNNLSSPKDQEGYQKLTEGLDMLGYGQLQLAESINFASATPSPSFFPVEDFKPAINSVLDRDKGEAFTYQKSQGYYPLRESIKNYLQDNGVNTKIENVQIVSGAQQAIDLLVKVLANYGDSVLVEEPTYSGALSAFRSRKAKIGGIPLLRDGMDLEFLEQELDSREVEFVYIMTSFQNPTGISWSNDKKKRLIELASKYNFFIVEDDCLSELYFKGVKPTPLKSYDQEGRVIYIKSFSKIFMPGLRLAFMVLPERLLSPVLAAKHATDISSAGLTQRAFDFYLRKGLWSKHLEEMRHFFGQRFQWMQKAVEDHLPPSVELFYLPDGGLYFWLSLPDGYDSKVLYRRALEQGVAFLPGDIFSASKGSSSYFRLSFAAVGQEDIQAGMKILGEVCKKQLTSKSASGYTPLV